MQVSMLIDNSTNYTEGRGLAWCVHMAMRGHIVP